MNDRRRAGRELLALTLALGAGVLFLIYWPLLLVGYLEFMAWIYFR